MSGVEADKGPTNKEVLERVAKALENMKYGEVMIKVNAGKVVFIDRIERDRL